MTSTYPVRFRRNVLTTYVSTAVLALLALATTPLLAHQLGKEGYGIWVLVGSFALYLEVLEFGFGKAVPKFVAESEARGDAGGLRAVIATSFFVLAGLGGVALLVGLAAALAFPSLFDVSPDLVDATRLLVLLVLADLSLSIPMDTFGGVLMGLQRFYLVNVTLVVVSLLQAVAWVIVFAAGGGLLAIGIVTVALSTLGQLSRYVLARRHVGGGIRLSPRLVDRQVARRFTGVSGWFFVLDLSKLAQVRLDLVVVGLVAGVPAAGVYAVGQRLTLALEQFVDPLTKAFFPHASAQAARADAQASRRSLLAGTRLTLLTALPLALALSLFAPPLLRLWLGGGFGDAAIVVVLLASGVAAASITRTGFIMLQGSGSVRGPALFAGAEAALNLVLSVVLANVMGLEGVALGSLLAVVVVNLGGFYPYMCRAFGIPARSMAAILARAHLPALLAAGAVGAGLLALDPGGAAALACSAAVVAAYLGVFTLTGLEPGERRDLRQRVRGVRRTDSAR